MFLNPFLLFLCPHLTFPLLTSPHILHPLLFFPSFHLCLISPCYLHFLNSSLFYIFLVFFSLSSFLTSTQPVSFFLWSHLFKFTSSSCPNGSFPPFPSSPVLVFLFPLIFLLFSSPFLTLLFLLSLFSSFSFVFLLFLFPPFFFLTFSFPLCYLVTCARLLFPAFIFSFLVIPYLSSCFLFFSIPFPTFPFNCHCFYLFF